MQRIAIIGNAGGGKSALARKLGDVLELPVYQFDDLQWLPRWTPAPEDEILATHSKWLSEPKWIIDGWGNTGILEARFERADTIILIDFPIALHYWWAAKRQIKAAFNLNHGWPPEGCSALPVTGRLFKLMWKIHKDMRPQLIELIDHYSNNTQILRLRSPRELKEILQRVKLIEIS